MPQNNDLKDNVFISGIWWANPAFVLMVGLCPVLAITTTIYNSVVMAAVVSFVLICSGFTISLSKRAIPVEVKMPVFMVIITTYTTIADYIIRAYFIDFSVSLGVFIPLVAVNCIILNRVEIFSYKNSLGNSLIDALGSSVGFSLVIILVGVLREVSGNGALIGKRIFMEPVNMIVLPAGAFVIFGLLLGMLNLINQKLSEKNDK